MNRPHKIEELKFAIRDAMATVNQVVLCHFWLILGNFKVMYCKIANEGYRSQYRSRVTNA